MKIKKILCQRDINSIIGLYISIILIIRAFNTTIKGAINLSPNIYLLLSLLLCMFLFMTSIFFISFFDKKNKKIFFTLMIVTFFIVILSGLRYPNYTIDIYEKTSWIFIAGIPLFYFSSKITDYKRVYHAILNNILLIDISCYITYFFHTSKLSSNMVFSYTLILPLFFHLNELFDRKSKFHGIISLIDIVLLLLYGSRGCFLAITIYLIMYILVIKKYRPNKITIIVALIMCMLLIVFTVMNGFEFIFDLFLKNGKYVRNLDLLAHGTFFNNNGRFRIYSMFYNLIMQKPIIGWGIAADFVVGEYQHNLILELYFEFGLILGTILIGVLVYSLLRLFKTKNKLHLMLLVIFFSAGIIPLMLSSSYLEWLPFWCYMGLSFSPFGKLKTTRKNKIIFVFNQLGIGGASKSLANLVNWCYSEHYDTVIFSLSKNEKVVKFIGNPPILYLDYEANNLINEKTSIQLLEKCKLLIKYRRLCIKYDPDIIIAFMSNIVEITQIMNFDLRYKVIGSERGNPKRYNTALLKRYLNAYSQCKWLIVQTERAKLFFRDKVNVPIMVISNSCDIVKDKCQIEKSNIIFAAGRFSQDKGFDTLLYAFALLLKEYPDYQLKIYGDGPDSNKLNEIVINQNIEKNVSIIQGETNLFERERNAKLFVLSSYDEGMPNVVMEAMASHIPILSTDCEIGGPAELLQNGKGGFLVPVKNINALYEGMLYCIENYSEMEKKADESYRYINNYSSNSIREKWLILIKEVLNDC
ncbi:glycosyltransferase [[Clostridium] innocuum]|nr:glycosyltransferase [[Clostridium] innocuum]